MAKTIKGWLQPAKGVGGYVDVGRDPLVQGDRGDKPFGKGSSELNITVIDDHSSLHGGAARKLPRRA